MSYNSELFVLKIVTWRYHCLLRIIIIYLKPYYCLKTNEYYLIEIITWNHMIINVIILETKQLYANYLN